MCDLGARDAVSWVNSEGLTKEYLGTLIMNAGADLTIDEVHRIVNTVEDSDTKTRVLISASNAFSMRDPEKSARFIEGLSDVEAQAHATRNTTIRWMNKDREAAWEWLDGLAHGAIKDTGLSEFAWQLREDDPARAAKVVSKMPSGELRQEMIKRVVEDWVGRDRNTAAAEIGNLSFSSAELAE